jgi:hypothetical protein
MTIQVTKPYAYPELVCVEVDGCCNHADTETEIEYVDVYNPDGQDRSYEREILICAKCKEFIDLVDQYEEDYDEEG